ncbi:MAG: Rieske (2Fe-2S) protein [Pedobacter sp.]|nr:Rieske (2Fe-2S) protein [Pedobacter sp.]
MNKADTKDNLRWYKIEEKLPGGEFVMQVQVAGKKLCLLRHEGELHLVQNYCPHAGAVLSGGWCKNKMIICPVHRYAYNLDNGRGAEGQGDYIELYAVREEAEGVYAGFKQSLFSRLFGGRS